MNKTIVWDVGGVILRTEDRMPREALASKCGLDYDSLAAIFFGDDDNLRVQKDEISIEEHFRNVAAKLKIDHEEIPAFREQFFAGDEIDQKLVAWINSNRGRYEMVVLSNATLEMRDFLTTTCDIGKYFQRLFISAEMKMAKPSPEIFEAVIEELGKAPKNIYFVDDNLDNIKAAKALGIKSILFENRTQALKALEEELAK